MSRCKYLGCETKSESMFCLDHTPAKYDGAKPTQVAKYHPPAILSKPGQGMTHAERGSKGGKARASKLTAERRVEIAKAAIEARWKKARDAASSKDAASLGDSGVMG